MASASKPACPHTTSRILGPCSRCVRESPSPALVALRTQMRASRNKGAR